MRLNVIRLTLAGITLAGVTAVSSPVQTIWYPFPSDAGDSRTAQPPAVDLEQEIAPIHFVLAHGEADSELEEQAAREAVERRQVEVGRGDTLMKLLIEAAVPRTDAHRAIDALSEVYDPRKLQVGQQVTLLFRRDNGEDHFIGLEMEPRIDRAVVVERTADAEYEARAEEKALVRRLAAARGTIHSSLLEAGSRAGVPIQTMFTLIRAFSYDVDFQRDIQPGDRFEILYETYVTESGASARSGDVLYAALTLSGKELAIYRHTTRDGLTDYFNRKGESVRRALLRTPIDGARISSGFGMRRHPILGYSKMHKGVDFAAPTGTPIYAAGDGVIAEIGRKGAYGNYIRIRHNSEISTAYAHLSRFARSLRRGARVRQGDVIGYVGSTGRSTGPHLHYEVLRHDRQVNPLSVDLPTGHLLAGAELKAFQAEIANLDREFARLVAPDLLHTVSEVGVFPDAAPPECTASPC